MLLRGKILTRLPMNSICGTQEGDCIYSHIYKDSFEGLSFGVRVETNPYPQESRQSLLDSSCHMGAALYRVSLVGKPG